MEFKKYQHIEKLGREECEGILEGTVTIQPKIDGTCSSIWMGDDGLIHYGSRNRELTLDNDNANFMRINSEHHEFNNYLVKHKNHILFGEWLVPHSLKTYNEEAWKKFYVFDVFEYDEIKDTGRYLPYDEYVPMLESFNIEYIPEVKRLINPTKEDVEKVINEVHYLMPDNCIPEGIIIKNYSYYNKYGRMTWAKIVSEEFFNSKSRLRTKNRDIKTSSMEVKIANDYISDSLIKKEYCKVLEEYKSANRNELIGRVLSSVYEAFLNEELLDVIHKNKNCTISFNKMRTESNNRVKEVLKEELF